MSASANLERTSDSGFIQQLLQAEQLVGKLQIQYNTVKDGYDRIQTLYSAEAVSKKDLDDAKSQYDAITIDLKNAKDSLELLKSKSGPQATKAAAAAVEQAQAGVSAVQNQINNATITAPIAGVVSEKAVEVGQLAGGQSGSITVIDHSSLSAEINIPDKMLVQIQVGLSVPVTINALPDAKIVGIIDNISPNTSSKNNFYVVKVKIGISDEKFTEVTGEVQEGLDIISEGQNLLSDGEKVNLV